MTDMLIRNIEPKLKTEIEESARRNKRSLSREAKELLRLGLAAKKSNKMKLGTWLFESVPAEFRGDDLVFEYRGDFPKPPDFE
jgi:plasmid stability protein